ncbi:MAG: hypothetical protein IJU13_04590 [Bacteroidales bacterium]|nr:hypothetical protein [Bacteroidales bacterium]
MKQSLILCLLAVAAILCFDRCSGSGEIENIETLKADFQNPPQQAKPMVWWHWLNGNITEDGLRKDIAWMHSIGIGGFHVFDANLNSPQMVKERLEYMSPAWKKAFAGAIAMADSLGMETVVAASPGWSCTGGPWVEPRDAMKKLSWRTLEVQGGDLVKVTLPDPYAVSSRFQNIPVAPDSYYEDIAVMAVRFPENRCSLSQLGARVSSSGGTFSVEELTDRDLDNGPLLPAHPSGYAWVQYSFPEPVAFRGITFVSSRLRKGGHNGPLIALDSLQISDDGVHWKTHTPLYLGALPQQTLSFPLAKARYWRYKKKNPEPSVSYGRVTAPAAKASKFPEFVLYPDAPLNHFEEKAAYNIVHDIQNYPSDADAAPALSVVDVSACCKDGVLEWEAPAGQWTLYRYGWSLTGKKNHPASPEATGLEVDKLDPEAMCRYLHHYLDIYKDAADGLLGKKGIRYLLIDSYESEGQNWTRRLPEEFRKRRGYDLLPFLPALSGVIIGSAAQTDDFLWDFRQTLGELFAENYAEVTRVVREDYGMEGVFIESHEHGRNFPSDGMSIKKTASYPMGALWCPPGPIARKGREFRYEEGTADIRESASVAHIYGQNLVAAESMTAAGSDGAAYSYSPSKLKRTADNEFAAGVNRIVIHEVSHQPLDNLFPGYAIGVYGQWFNRHETWAYDAGDWISYLARTDALLQKGRFVADFLYYYGEDTNVTARFGQGGPDVPQGYSFDFASPEVLLKEVSVRKGRLVTRSGMSYGMLYVEDGGLRRSPQMQARLQELARSGVKVVDGGPLSEALAGMSPDVSFADGTSMRFVHRSHPAAEIYWIANQKDSATCQELSFRISGRKPWLYHPEDGSIRELSYRFVNGRTVVPLSLVSDEAVFVVFAEKTSQESLTLPQPVPVSDIVLDGPWEVSFQPGRGAPDAIRMSALRDWSSFREAGIQYFSGKAVYKKKLWVEPVDGERYTLDLGDVRNLARIRINGHATRVLWKAPFKADVTEFLKPGENELEIEVTNLWVNRLIGDEQPGARRLTFTTYPYFSAQDALLPSGLLGPVRLLSGRVCSSSQARSSAESSCKEARR